MKPTARTTYSAGVERREHGNYDQMVACSTWEMCELGKFVV